MNRSPLLSLHIVLYLVISWVLPACLFCKFLEGPWWILFFLWWQSRSAPWRSVGTRPLGAGVNHSIIHSFINIYWAPVIGPQLCTDVRTSLPGGSPVTQCSSVCCSDSTDQTLLEPKVSGFPGRLEGPCLRNADVPLLILRDVCGPDFLSTTLEHSNSHHLRH